jgi:hypothetical protein
MPVRGYDRHPVSKQRDYSRLGAGATRGASDDDNTAATPREMLNQALALLRETQRELLAAHSCAETQEQRRMLKTALNQCSRIEQDIRAVAREEGRFLGTGEIQ